MTFANTLPSDKIDATTLARSSGRVEVSFSREGSENNLKHLFQSGCGRVRFPAVDNVHAPEAVLINTSGGLTGGDHMAYDILVNEGAKLTVTGQAAEKIYKSVGPDVVIDTHLTVANGGYLEWLPQETILFNRARLHRINKVDLAADAQLLAVEATIFGRQAHGETVHEAALTDGWEVRQENKLVWFDRFRFDGMMSKVLSRAPLLNKARAMATLITISPDNDALLLKIRAFAEEAEGRIGVTQLNDGPLIVRLLDENPYQMRKNVMGLISLIREKMTGKARPMPAVWEV